MVVLLPSASTKFLQPSNDKQHSNKV